MKKIISILSVVSLFLFTGCETTATLDGGVDERVQAMIDSYTEALAAAENGWIFDVNTSEGYYRFHMDFTTDNHVTMYTDNTYYLDYRGIPRTSTYNIRSLQRPVLSFDTYNYISILSDPDPEISHGSGFMGLETDFEFEIDSLGKDGNFYLTGRVRRVAAMMRPARADELAAVKDGVLTDRLTNITEYHSDAYTYIQVDDAKMDVRLSPRSVTMVWVDEADNAVVKAGFIQTELDYNIRFVEPFQIAGKELTGIVWDEATQTYHMVLSGTNYEIKSQASAAVPLYKALGEKRNYKKLASLLSMYPTTNPSENYFASCFEKDNAICEKAFGENLGLQQINLEFRTVETAKEGEKDRMIMDAVFAGGFSAFYTFYITYDANNPARFRVNKYTLEDDGTGNAKILDGLSFITSWVGKTFELDWSKVSFGSYFMGQLEQVGGTPSVYYGALMTE